MPKQEEAVERTVEQKLQTANEASDEYAALADLWRGRYMELATCIFTVEQIARASQDDLHAALKSELLKARIDTTALRSQIERELGERLEELDRYVIGTGSLGGHYQERTIGVMHLMNEENARGEKGQWLKRPEVLAALTTATHEGEER